MLLKFKVYLIQLLPFVRLYATKMGGKGRFVLYSRHNPPDPVKQSQGLRHVSSSQHGP